MHFDIESALAIVGGEALEEAKKQAKAQNITLDVGYTQGKNKIILVIFCNLYNILS